MANKEFPKGAVVPVWLSRRPGYRDMNAGGEFSSKEINMEL